MLEYHLKRSHDNVTNPNDHITRRATAWDYVTDIRALEIVNETERDEIFVEDIVLSMIILGLYKECEDKTGYAVIRR
jgi:hypothetical protein